MKKLLIMLALLVPATASAQMFYSNPDVTVQACSGGNTQVLAAANNAGGAGNRFCTILTNSGAAKARCGDNTTSATKGPEISTNSGSITVCTISALYCCGEGATTTISSGDTRNQ